MEKSNSLSYNTESVLQWFIIFIDVCVEFILWLVRIIKNKTSSCTAVSIGMIQQNEKAHLELECVMQFA